MTINHVLDKIKEIMCIIEGIDFNNKDIRVRDKSQRKINKAYDKLDLFKSELEREKIINKQRRNKKCN